MAGVAIPCPEVQEVPSGDLVDKIGQKPGHSFAIGQLVGLLTGIFGGWWIRTLLPVEVTGYDATISFPEPDVSVTSDIRNYSRRHPNASELALAVEVSDSTLKQDTVLKRDIYARAGLHEYWVLDITGRKLVVFRTPVAGIFTEAFELDEAEMVPHSVEAGLPTPIAALLP